MSRCRVWASRLFFFFFFSSFFFLYSFIFFKKYMYRLLQYNDYADYATTDVRMWDFYPDRGQVFRGASFRPNWPIVIRTFLRVFRYYRGSYYNPKTLSRATNTPFTPRFLSLMNSLAASNAPRIQQPSKTAFDITKSSLRLSIFPYQVYCGRWHSKF